MRRLPLLLALPLLALLLHPSAVHAGPPAGEPAVVAFVDVHVLPMDAERVLRHQTVLVRGDRIAAVGPVGEVEVPEGALRIAGAGRYLMPGLAEMHGHVPPPSAAPQYVDDVLFLYVANGITTVRGMLGWEGQLALKERARRGEVVAPTLYLAGPSFNGRSVGSPAQAEQMVRAQVAEGWDLLKVHPGLSRDEFDAMARTADELGIRFGGHVPEDVGLLHALAMGQETIDHLDGYVEYVVGDGDAPDPGRLAHAVRASREAGTWVVPTMALWETILGASDLERLRAYPELRYMPPDDVRRWAQAVESIARDPRRSPETARRTARWRLDILRALHDGGVPVLMGTDAPQLFSVPGFSLHRELERMAAAGLSPFAILQSGTRNVGRYFGHKDAFGTVAPDQRADLVLVDGNPLDDLAHLSRPAGVMVRGLWLPRTELDRRLEGIARRHEAEGRL